MRTERSRDRAEAGASSAAKTEGREQPRRATDAAQTDGREQPRRATDAAQTDGREQSRRESDAAGAPLSRRSLLAAGAALGGAGLPGIGSASADPGSRHVATATAPYLATLRDALAEQGAGPDLEVRRAAGDATKPLDDGDVAVHVSGRPVLPVGGGSDASGTDGSGGPKPADAVAVSGRAALGHADGEWRDCLPRSAVREAWAGAAPVETWSEVPDAAPSRAIGTGSASAGDGAPAGDAEQIVRGTRSAQYAWGCGGESYYAVESDALDALPDAADAGGTHTALARLAYVHVDERVRGSESVGALLDRLRSQGSGNGHGAAFLDPAVDDA